ncbi:MAG TPA: phenylacetate--CoA ligase family protein, partial [Thermoplasmatales archaeon]|nr:phenylacetate--CoA ligase family protein [Thermoplasmatales archaeon]
MNPLLNPLFAAKILKHYLIDVGRAWKLKPDKLRDYQNKSLKKTLRYANTVPLYNKKYEDANVSFEDIKTVEDIKKIPFTTKDDLINGFPDDIVPLDYKKEKAYVVGTSGSSGKPMQMYKDIEYIFIEALGGLRMLKAYGLSWRKSRITNVGDFSMPKTTDEECLKKGLLGTLSSFFSLKNYQNLYTGEEARTLMEKMDHFKPELLIAYTSVLHGLATLKMKGFGKNVNPKYIVSSGEVLDEYTREYIQDAFNAKVLNLYATTEGGTIAFECDHGKLHINSDFVHVEVFNGEGEEVEGDGFGNIVITRLFPGGTPIVRYTGLNDIVSVSSEKCSCGMN